MENKRCVICLEPVDAEEAFGPFNLSAICENCQNVMTRSIEEHNRKQMESIDSICVVCYSEIERDEPHVKVRTPDDAIITLCEHCAYLGAFEVDIEEGDESSG